MITAGDVEAWTIAIKNFLEKGESSPLSSEKLTSFEETVSKTEDFYKKILGI